ncbi:putative GNAT family acetyltransferase [Seiridium unicorne]|uniref:GNAT family acetyltransferase n=1 Tax=Seiridium unicorne TaxID=138068 RepID=A0ABR2VJH7_9PEZI
MGKPIDPFNSKRLLYRAVEDNSEDEELIYQIQRDAEAQSGSSFGLLLPESKRSSNKFKEHLLERVLMSAIVCLPPDSAGQSAEPANPTPVGIIVLNAQRKGTEHHRHSYISIDILKPYRGKGYGAEAIEWSLGFGFQMAGLHRVGIETFTFNTGAMRLYEKLGFVLEGRKREEIWFDGEWHDYVTYGILENEWRDKMKKEGRKWRE